MSIAHRSESTCFALRYLIIFVATLSVAGVVQAQIVTTTTSVTDGRTPGALQPGSPAGSYPLSGFDNVNLYNGNLNFRLPLLQVGGRGSVGMTITLALNLKSWRIKHIHKEFPDESTLDSYVPTQTGSTVYPGYGAGHLSGRNYGLHTSSNLTCRWYSKTLSRLTFSSADGTEYELRDQATNGQPLTSSCTQGASRGTVFVTADGTAATFISDAAIYDNPAVNTTGPHAFTVSGYLMLRDGNRYRIDGGNVSWIRDRNGNKITFTYTVNSMTITDPLNRTITINYDVSDVAPYGLCDQIIYKGFGGAPRILRVSRTNLGSALRSNSGYSIRTLGGPTGLFPETNGSSSTNYDPIVTSAVWLPDGNRNYKFYYNSYGELARVELPTGGAYEYDMTPGSGVICPNGCAWADEDREIYRRVVERRVYSNGSSGASFEHKEIYTNTEAVGSNSSTVTREQIGPTGSVLARSRHFFNGSALDSLFGGDVVYAYGAWYEGTEYQTDLLDVAGSISSATVLRRTVTARAQRAAVSWWPSHASTYGLNINEEPPNDPRVTEIVSTLEPATSNLVSKQTFDYDDSVPFNNQNSVKEYGFNNGSPAGLLRETRTTYLTSSTYTDPNVHIRNLPTRVSIYDPMGTEQARSTSEYDNHTVDTYHAGLTPRPNISGLDSAFTTSYTTRGNRTASTHYLLVNGAETGLISSYSQYDVAGNIIKTIDPRSTPTNIIATTIEYDDRFGSPDIEARSNTGPTELIGFASFAVPTRIVNPLGHTTYAQFDYHLGEPINGEDPNGIVSAGYFNDLLDRPTQVRRAVGTSLENQSTIAYDDTNRIVTTSSDRDTNNDNLLVDKVLYDQLGRTIEQRQYEGGANYISTQTQYDGLGRSYKISNPYRQGEGVVWTTQVFDGLSRVVSMTTPDSAVVNTSYSGNSVTVTDQAGKARKSVTDALGRLIEVYEDPVGFNYQTAYLYDTLDNLVKVTQGTQQRIFMYDSLRRLIRARNPEQNTNANLILSDPVTGNSAWSTAYQYDSSGNLLQKTDARGVVSTYAYDAFDRNTTIDYSDTASINPDIERFYDGATNGKGRFWYFYKTGDISTGSNVEHTAVDSYDAMGRPLVQRQLFKLNGTWGPTYQTSRGDQTSRGYNLAGAVTSQTYPSGHTVSYLYDAAGRTTSLTGNLGDGVSRNYATTFVYNARNQLTQELFGTQTPLYHKLQYNIRGQLWDVRVATGSDVNGSWNRGCLQFFYESTYTHGSSGPDNNGNVLKTNHYVPMDEQSSTWAIYDQFYNYDPLNRLSSVADYFVSSTQPHTQQSLQTYSYDRWGNRKINTAQTWGTGINNKAFDVDTATNRLTVGAGQSGAMNYDAAGNLITDTYTGAGSRTYDAENRMTTAADYMNQTSRYTYDADGRRVRVQVGSSAEKWHVYGFDGELLAEYPATAAASAPEKEYGYRNGQLVVTAAPPTVVNVALAANGAVATASSAYDPAVCGSSAASANDGDRTGRARCNHHVWNDAAPANTFPDWLQIDFNGSKTITEIDLITIQDHLEWPVEPTEAMTFSQYGLTTFQVQYWNNSTWVTIPGGSVSGNNKVWRKFTFSALTTTKMRVLATASADGYSRIVELEAWTGPSPAPRYDLALGATATASTSYPGWGASAVVNGDRKSLNAYSDGAWSSSAANNFPEWVVVDFGVDKTINEIHIFTLQDNWAGSTEPTEAMTFTLYGLTGYEVQYWTGSSWLTVPGGSVTGNDKIWKTFTFSPISTSKIRVLTNAALDGVSRITEIEAYGPADTAGSSNGVQWLVADHLGTPRIILDQTGSLATVKRHDYLPFGEELFAGTGGRTAAHGYTEDGVRQQFTSKERDVETGLDYFLARYYSSLQGRFTSPDEFTGGPEELYYFVDDASDNPTFYGVLSNPQSLNKYQYGYNNPLRYVDPDGHEPTPEPQDPCGCADIQKQANKIRADIRKLDEITSKPLLPITDLIGTSTPPPIGPVALPNDPTVVAAPKPQAMPQAPPAPIQAHPRKKQSTGKNKDHKKDTERPGRKQPPNYRPFRRPDPKPKPPPQPPKPKPEPKPEIGPDGNPVKPPGNIGKR